MFGFLKKAGKANSLDKIVQELEMNMSNNYKDAAQENFREFEQTLNHLEAAGKLSEAQISNYKRKLSLYKEHLWELLRTQEWCSAPATCGINPHHREKLRCTHAILFSCKKQKGNHEILDE